MRQHVPQLFKLVVSQGIHREQQQRLDPWLQRAGLGLLHQGAENGQQVALCFSAACACSHDDVFVF